MGVTIPEFLLWYYERPRKRNWDYLTQKGNMHTYSVSRYARAYSRLYQGEWKRLKFDATPSSCLQLPQHKMELPFFNRHAPQCMHAIVIIPWMAFGGADELNVRLVETLTRKGYRVTIVCTLSTFSRLNERAMRALTLSLSHTQPRMQKFTEDIFVLPHFLNIEDYPRFLIYLIISRQASLLITSQSVAGYCLLPTIKQYFPDLRVIDYLHIVEDFDFKCGEFEYNASGFAGASVVMAPYIDHTVAVSRNISQWLCERVRHACSSVSVAYAVVETQNGMTGAIERVRSPFAVLFVGRLVRQKAPMLALTVFERFLAKVRPGQRG